MDSSGKTATLESGARSGGITACREHTKEFIKYEISYLQTSLQNCVNVYLMSLK